MTYTINKPLPPMIMPGRIKPSPMHMLRFVTIMVNRK